MLDVSHMNQRGFMELAALTTAPVVATHCGAHAVCRSSRNLLDEQLDVVRDSNGLVGVNFHVGFLRPDGADDADTPLTVIADHLVHGGSDGHRAVASVILTARPC